MRAVGIEPTMPAWEADVLPLNYARIDVKSAIVIKIMVKLFACCRRKSIVPASGIAHGIQVGEVLEF